MNFKFLFNLVLLFFPLVSNIFSQTSPFNSPTNAFQLENSNFSCNSLASGSSTYPVNMNGCKTSMGSTLLTYAETNWFGGNQPLISTGSPTGGVLGISNLGLNGFNLYGDNSTVSAVGKVGSICLALNTMNRENVLVSWLADDIQSSTNNKQMALTLQYCILSNGSNDYGTFTTVLNSTYLTNPTSSAPAQNFINIPLPSICDHKPYVLLRWIYYENGAQTGAKEAIRLDNITVSSSPSTLPVELTSFSSIYEDNNTVSVNWTTASEHNSDFFLTEKSRDAINWANLSTVKAAGNSMQTIQYSVKDKNANNGTNYYRLSQVDLDGTIKMYDIISTNCAMDQQLSLLAYPNPSNGQFTVKIENAAGGMYALEITDIQGKAIEQQNIDLETGTTVVKMSHLGLQTGVYLLQFLQDGQSIQLQKIVIE